MKITHKYLLPIAAVAVISSAAYGITSASAATTTTGAPTLVNRIASTFGLDKSKVQAVIDADHTAHVAERATANEARLTAAVAAGKITAAQKTAILTEQAKLDAMRSANKIDPSNETQAQREAHHTAMKAEIDAWAKANNIDASWLGGPRMGAHGPGGMGHGMMDNDAK
jgi:hypothetical protein